MPEKEYRRLTRPRLRRKGFMTILSITRSSLWLGRDHLLHIDSTHFAEEYKRFYFRDIQAFIMRKNNRWALWNTALIVLLILGPAGAFEVWSVSGRNAALLASILAVPLLVNNLLGPTCTVHLRTAVQVEELPSLNRIRRANKVLGRIRLLIVAAQGQLAPEEILMRMRESREGTQSLEVSAAPGAPGLHVVTDPIELTAFVDEPALPSADPNLPPQIGVKPL